MQWVSVSWNLSILSLSSATELLPNCCCLHVWNVACQTLTVGQVNIQLFRPDCATGWVLIVCVRVMMVRMLMQQYLQAETAEQ